MTSRSGSRCNDLEEVMRMAKNTGQTGPRAASAAAKTLASPSATKAEKSAAASALAQTPSHK